MLAREYEDRWENYFRRKLSLYIVKFFKSVSKIMKEISIIFKIQMKEES